MPFWLKFDLKSAKTFHEYINLAVKLVKISQKSISLPNFGCNSVLFNI
jgi:hypothetical protein